VFISQVAGALSLYSEACSSRYYGKVSQDGFGTRTLSFDPASGDPVEILTFVPVLARAPEFAAAVGERVARLARVRHTMYARTRKLDRLAEDKVRLVSDHVAGWRLAHVLDVIERERLTLDISAVITLLRQLIPAVALFSRHQRDATIGTVGPERLILTPQGRLVLAEYVLTPGLEKLQFPRERLWREFRVVVPFGAGSGRMPPSADVVGIGLVAISLLLGRRLKDDEYLVSLGDLSETLTETNAGTTRKLSASFLQWVAHALQFEPDEAYRSPQEAQVAFEEMLARERSYVTTAAQLDRFISQFERIAGAPRTPSADREEPSFGAPLSTPSRADVGATDSSLVATLAAMAPAPARRDSGVRHAVAAATVARVEAPAPVARVEPADPVAHVETPAPVARLEAPPPVVRVEAPAPIVETPAADPDPPAAAEVVPAWNASRAPTVDDPPTVSSGAPRVAAAEPVWRRFAVPALAAVVLIQAGVIGWLATRSDAAPQTGGALTIQSRPVAARVSIDGEERGVTPFEAEVSPGSHVVEVRVGRSEPRVIPVVIRPGVQTGLYVELQSVATVGGLEVRSEPARARVTVGGQYRGETPLVLQDLPPGEVDVVVQSKTREVRQTVRIEPGITSQLVVPLGR
jgi:hypothetical protein